jgi:uncharacterized membrane protein
MLDDDAFKILTIILIVALILSPFGVWKVVELIIWLIQHIHWG